VFARLETHSTPYFTMAIVPFKIHTMVGVVYVLKAGRLPSSPTAHSQYPHILPIHDSNLPHHRSIIVACTGIWLHCAIVVQALFMPNCSHFKCSSFVYARLSSKLQPLRFYVSLLAQRHVKSAGFQFCRRATRHQLVFKPRTICQPASS